VGWTAILAGLTPATVGVDLAHHALALQGSVWAALYDADELMAQHSSKVCVTTDDFQIGVADPGIQDAHQRFVWRGFGLRIVINQRNFPIKHQSIHTLLQDG
jgi:hypothetical protein